MVQNALNHDITGLHDFAVAIGVTLICGGQAKNKTINDDRVCFQVN